MQGGGTAARHPRAGRVGAGVEPISVDLHAFSHAWMYDFFGSDFQRAYRIVAALLDPPVSMFVGYRFEGPSRTRPRRAMSAHWQSGV